MAANHGTDERKSERTEQRAKSLYEAVVLTRPTRILIADEQDWTRSRVALMLRAEGYEVVEAVERGEVFEYLDQPLGSCNPKELPELIIADLDLFGGPGWFELLAQLRQHGRKTPVIFLASGFDATEQLEAYRLGSAYIFEKSCPTDVLRLAALNLARPR